jgi:hypothetical protein
MADSCYVGNGHRDLLIQVALASGGGEFLLPAAARIVRSV